MPFPYYDRLSRRQQAIYRSSDRVTEVRLPQPELLHDLVELLRRALAEDRHDAVQATAQAVALGITRLLLVPPVKVLVLAVRPASGWGELHGLYTAEERRTPVIRVWMRTAQKGRVVAFRTFLRTLLHELVHHLDYHHLKLGDSLHTEGFFRRESSLFRQIVRGEAERSAATGPGPS